eukprot:5498948-Prymnesium_polylepis.1
MDACAPGGRSLVGSAASNRRGATTGDDARGKAEIRVAAGRVPKPQLESQRRSCTVPPLRDAMGFVDDEAREQPVPVQRREGVAQPLRTGAPGARVTRDRDTQQRRARETERR